MTITTSAQPAIPAGITPRWLITANETIFPALQEAIAVLHPDLRHIAAYHKGWADASGKAVTGRSPGKGVRPALSLWAAQAADAAPETGLPAAVAVELIHDFTLLHDDIIDNDRTRRGRSAAWTVYGTGPALLCGDTLHALAHGILADAGPRGPEASRRLAQAVLEICRGQAADVSFERRDHVSVQEYLSMVECKTGALFRCSITLGAVLAEADTVMIHELDRLGFHLGMLFQIVDDLLGVFGDPAVTGKPVGSDLARRKKTLPILSALAWDGDAGRALAELLSHDDLTHQDIEHATAFVEQAGGRDRAQRECTRHHHEVIAALTRLDLAEQPTMMLQELLAFLMDRTF